jgi:hypothetical protein
MILSRLGLSVGILHRHWTSPTESKFVNLSRSLGIDSQPGGSVRQPYLTCRPAGLHRLAESIPLNRFLGSFNVYKFELYFSIGLGVLVTYEQLGLDLVCRSLH